MFLDFLKSIVYGIVEGITEWLPISSTGHMILLEKIMPMHVSDDFWQLFLVVIQLGAIMAVVIMYWKRLWPIRTGPRNGKPLFKRSVLMMWAKVIVACIPAVIIGVLWDDLFERLFYNYICVAIALIVFGILFILVENRNEGRRPVVNKISELSFRTAFYIGLFQCLAAIFPGTSRSGATILGALLLGVSRTCAAEFTFFMAVPVMFGASLLKIIKIGLHFTFGEFILLLVGIIVAFLVSVFAIRFLMGYIRKNNFKPFGVYRIVLGLIVLAFAIFAH